MFDKLKRKFKGWLKKILKRIFYWIMGSSTSSKAHNNPEHSDIYINNIKFNAAITNSNLDINTKRIMVAQMFYGKIGYYPDINNPKTFSEKVLWLKLYYHDSRITVCSDKYHGKEYIDNILGPGYTVPVIKRYATASDIDFDELPDKFVLKVNWCTGYNIIVTDKSKLNKDEVRAKLDMWCLPWKCSYYGSFNWGYKDMKPVIFAEEYLDIPDNNTEYKFFCFNGKANFVIVEMDYFGKRPQRAYYDRNWNSLPFKMEKIPKAEGLTKPATFESMIEIADKLSEPFPYVRVDFYDIAGKLYVGELTFYSGGGFTRISPSEWDAKLGEQLNITGAMEKMALETAEETAG